MAVAEGRSVPTLKGGEDVRPLNMDDFKQAHERVTSSILVCMCILICIISHMRYS